MTDQEILSAMERMLNPIQKDIAKIKDDIENIKENSEITRDQVNRLSDWAEQAQIEVKIPLYRKAE